MIDTKFTDILTGILIVFAVVFVVILTISPDTLGITKKESPASYSHLFEEDAITQIEITINEEDWADILENPLTEEYHRCDITINGVTYPSIGIRTKGMTSLSQVASTDSDRYSFKLKADEYVNDQTFSGLQEFVINNVYQDATYMKEYLSYDLMEYIGVPTPLVAYASISINGELFGLYVMVETVEEDFASRVFGKNYGHLYKPDPMSNAGGGFGGPGERPPGMMMNMSNGSPPEFFRNGEFGNMNLHGFEEFNQADPQNQDERKEQWPSMTVGVPPGENREWDGQLPEGGFGGSGGGADLVYTDDEISSYSQIFDNTVFAKTKDSDKRRVITALKNLNEETDLETYVNVDEVLRYFAANTVLVNLDSYAGNLKHNYYLYENGKAQISILPWDFNLAFGGFGGSGGPGGFGGFSGFGNENESENVTRVDSASSIINFPIDTPVSGVSLEDRPLIGVLLRNPDYLERYHTYLREIIDGYFTSGYYAEKIKNLNSLIEAYVQNDPTAFYTYDEYQKAINALILYGELRTESIEGQLNGTIPSTAEGQAADSSALVDAAGLNMNDLGTMGGGRGGPEDREPGQRRMGEEMNGGFFP